MSAAGVAGWLVEALVASALLMLLVLALRGPVRRAFGPQVAYWLWALPALRLALPPLPESWRERVGTPIARAGEFAVVLIEPAGTAATTPVEAGLPWATLLVVAWAIGAGGFFVLHLWRHRRFCARLLGQARVVDRIDGVRVIESDAASGPLAFGIARRFVAFPSDFADRYDAEERDLALAHELAHHQRGDLVANWIALAVLALHWFDPIAWRAFRAFRCDQELANDARVLIGRSHADRHAYACAILKAAHGGTVSAACHLHTITDLKGRLKMLTNARISTGRVAAGTAAVLATVTAGLVLTASGTRAAAAVSERIESVSVNLRTPATPSTPTAPTGAINRIMVVKDGQTRVLQGAEATRYAAQHALPVPPAPPAPPAPGAAPRPPVAPIAPVNITSAECGATSDTKAYVVTRRENGADHTVICTDRIEAAAKAGQMTEADQQTIERQAMTAALASLKSSRAAMLANPQAGGEQREAVAEMDSAIKEMEAEIADIGKN